MQLGRKYAGLEISKAYVENTKKRLARLKKQSSRNLYLNTEEFCELQRLFVDMAIPAREIAGNKKLLKLFTNQFSVRMNNKKQYKAEKIVTALEDLVV